MKQKMYCKNCNSEFTAIINKMSDFDNIICPSCNSKVDKTSKKIVNNNINSSDMKLSKFLSIYCYIYFIFSIIGVIGYFMRLNILLKISAIICLFFYSLERLFHINRIFLGYISLISFSIVFYIVFNSFDGIFFGICLVFIIDGLITKVFNLFIRLLDKILQNNKN